MFNNFLFITPSMGRFLKLKISSRFKLELLKLKIALVKYIFNSKILNKLTDGSQRIFEFSYDKHKTLCDVSVFTLRYVTCQYLLSTQYYQVILCNVKFKSFLTEPSSNPIKRIFTANDFYTFHTWHHLATFSHKLIVFILLMNFPSI